MEFSVEVGFVPRNAGRIRVGVRMIRFPIHHRNPHLTHVVVGANNKHLSRWQMMGWSHPR